MLKTLMGIAAVSMITVSSVALADPGWGFGARVGGYGFRQVTPDGEMNWDDCRMGGVGLFAERRFGRHAFAEAGLDFYQADGETVAVEAMDRVSKHATIAAGLRAFPGRLISPYVQVGAGAEWTTIAMHGHEGSYLFPTGFIGLGADVRLGRHLRLGMNVRFHVMEHFDHVGDGSGEMHHDPAPVSQGQFFVRYDM